MALYNLSFMDSATNFLDLAVGIGTVTGQSFLLGNLILLSFFMIFLILSLRHNFLEVLIIDCFLSTIVAILLYITGLISAVTIVYPFILMMIALIIYLFS